MSNLVEGPKQDQEIIINELVKILTASHCPLITRNDYWWMEELLLKAGKPRTDLLLWMISKLTNSVYPPDNDHDCTSTSSVSSLNYKLPENDEGIIEFFSQSSVLCLDLEDYKSFVQGKMSVDEQLQLWTLLIYPLQNIDKHSTNTMVSNSYNTINNIVSMDNFLDAFQLTATLLPADLRSEISQRNKKHKPAINGKAPISDDVEFLYDEAFSQNLTEQAQQLKSVSENFLSVYNSDLKTKWLKDSTSNLVDIGQSSSTILSSISNWKQNMDSLLELHRRSAMDKARHKTDEILERCIKDKAYECFQDLCQNEWP